MCAKNKWKHILPLLLAILLLLTPAATAQDILVPETQPTKAPDDLTDYQTVEVTRGSIIHQMHNATASVYYPLEQQVVCQENGVRFQKYVVEAGDIVKKGDLIAYLYRPGNQTDLARLRLNLQQAEESMREAINQRQARIDQLQVQVNEETDIREREILRLTIEYHKTDLELYKYEQQKSIDSRKESLARYDPIPVYATMDGTVTSLRAKPEDELSSGSILMIIRDERVRYLRVKSGASSLAYNLPLLLTPSVAGNQDGSAPAISGRVIAAQNTIPSTFSYCGDSAYLLPDPGQALTDATVYRINCDLRRIDDILIIPEEALADHKSHQAYATVLLPDGSTETRLITLGNSAAFYDHTKVNDITRYFWVMDGLVEGDTVILWE